MKSRTSPLRLLVYLLLPCLLCSSNCGVGEIGGLGGEGMKYECETPVLKCPQKNEPLKVTVNSPLPQGNCYSTKPDLKVGDQAYCDKNWVVHKIDADELKGSQYVMTRHADNTGTYPGFLQLQALNDADGVYVAYDSRARSAPDWLKTYTQLNKDITIANGDKFIDLSLWRREPVKQGESIDIPANFSGNPSSWPTGLKPEDTAMYMVILKPVQTKDCGKANPKNPEKIKRYAACHNTTTVAEQQASRFCTESIQFSPYNLTCGPPSCTTEKPCGVEKEVKKMIGKNPTPLSFTRSSEIEFNPASFKSVANVKIMGKTYTRNVTGTLDFEYVLDGAGRMWEVKINNMLLKLDPLNTDAGNFTDVAIDLLNPVTATCKNKQSAPWATPCDVYIISPNTFFAGLSTKRGSQTLIYAAKNTKLLEIHIADHKRRIFRIARGPLSTFVKINGKDKPLDIDIDLTGHFLNFAPQARGGETKKFAVCAEDKNRDAILLDAGASFEIYNDPIPGSAYKWYEDYGLVTERFLGQGKRVSIAPYSLSYGVHDITLAIRDSHGVTDTDTFEFEVRDKTPPDLIVPGDVSILPEQPGPVKVDIGQASYSDTCSSEVMISNDAPQGLLFPPGVTQVTWKADDGRGNVATGVQKVSVFSSGDKMPEGPGFEPSAETRCDQYANTAISQYMKNMESACGFTGPAWSPDYNHHYDWCMRVPRTQSEAGTSQRADDLANRCGAAQPSQPQGGAQPSQPQGGGTMSGPEVRCDQYANTAISQHRQNMEKACGFTGPAWSPDYRHHYDWCVRVPKEQADAGMKMRTDELANRCAAAQPSQPQGGGTMSGPEVRCNQYANTAISQNRQNMERGCGLKGPAWSDNYSHHYDWCMRVPREQADAGTQMRSSDLQNKCGRVQ